MVQLENQATRSNRNLSIDALRAIAALLILFHHSCVSMSMGLPLYDYFLAFFRDYGYLGVHLFFILSGLCIHLGHSKSPNDFSLKTYLLRRWWRIYPPYFFALGIAVILNIATNMYKLNNGQIFTLENFGFVHIMSHVFLIHNLSKDTLATVSGPFWTIAIEMQFYLLYILVRPLFFSGKGWLIVFSGAAFLHLTAVSLGRLDYSIQLLQPFIYWVEWVLGAYLAYLLRKTNFSILNKWGYFLALFVALSVCAYSLSKNNGRDTNESRHLLMISMTFLILFFLRWEQIWRLPVLKWVPFLGIFSYSIYLVHFPILDRFRAFVIPVIAEGPLRTAASFSAVLMCIGYSYIFFYFFEKPFLYKSSSIRAD